MKSALDSQENNALGYSQIKRRAADLRSERVAKFLLGRANFRMGACARTDSKYRSQTQMRR
jgi:hypothetical protein